MINEAVEKDSKDTQPVVRPNKRPTEYMDGNSAAAYVSHATNEIIAIYPITPCSDMGEIADQMSADGKENIWGLVPEVLELQSEAGAAGTLHGALTTGALCTTYTASQGLLLMIPNMFKIAGELTPTVFHVSARAVATHALSIFVDHSDVMAVRSTGFALLASCTVQEVMDMALISQAASLESRIPFVHFFDGFRTSHEPERVQKLTFDQMRQMIDYKKVAEHRKRSLTPDRPTIKGTSQNPDVFFQSREAVNKYYLAAPGIVQATMDRFAEMTKRQYNLFDYYGDKNAERVIVAIGTGASVVKRTVQYLMEFGEKVGVVSVRLYRPFSVKAFVETLPPTVKTITVLDRTKEPGAVGEPLYTDVHAAINEGMDEGWATFSERPRVLGGRYGIGSADWNTKMAKAVFDNMMKSPDATKNHFTIGIHDDVTNTSLTWEKNREVPRLGHGPDSDQPSTDEDFRCLFFGLGSDGTVGANKNSIKIIGSDPDYFVQGYFVYDSKKAGAVTVSHLRFQKTKGSGKDVQKPYLIKRGHFIACHNFAFLTQRDILRGLIGEKEKYRKGDIVEEGGTFLLNAPYEPEEVWDKIPRHVQKQIVERKPKFYVIDAAALAKEIGLGSRINIIMQTAFFMIAEPIPKSKAVEQIKESIVDTYGKKGEKVVRMNQDAVDAAVGAIHKVEYPDKWTHGEAEPPMPVLEHLDKKMGNTIAEIMIDRGDELPVSAFPDDGTYPTATTQYEKRNIALEIPVWDKETCIQCNICSLVCPHAAIRPKVFKEEEAAGAPPDFLHVEARTKQFAGLRYTLQVAPEDCTGCEICVNACPVVKKDAEGNKTDQKAIFMMPQAPIREREKKNWEFFMDVLPDPDQGLFNPETVKGSQFIRPLFEFSGACTGCGETPYIKLMTQLFGDRALCANATGCSSIYGGNLPTTPFCTRSDGKGPAWSNSLFEDNAEFGLGMRLTADKLKEHALLLTKELVPEMYDDLADADFARQEGFERQRARVSELKDRLKGRESEERVLALLNCADFLVDKSVWIIGGDGWAYDIGFGGLDHVLASGRNVNMLVLDTEVYSNTGGQMSKATPRASIAKFAAAGKPTPKKDLGLMMMSYTNVYVAQVALGASQNQTVKAMVEAERYNGPSLLICYSHCIAHGIDMARGLTQEELAVKSGHWLLYRFNPDLIEQGKNPLTLDSKERSISFADYAYTEARYRSLKTQDAERARMLIELGDLDCRRRWNLYSQLAKMDYSLSGQ